MNQISIFVYNGSQWVTMTLITWAPSPCYSRHFQVFKEFNSFLKNVLNFVDSKKGDYIFEEQPNSHLTVFLISFFLFFCGFLQKIERCWKNNLIWTTNWDGAQHRKHTDIIFVSNCSNTSEKKLKTTKSQTTILFYFYFFTKKKSFLLEKFIIFFSHKKLGKRVDILM